MPLLNKSLMVSLSAAVASSCLLQPVALADENDEWGDNENHAGYTAMPYGGYHVPYVGNGYSGTVRYNNTVGNNPGGYNNTVRENTVANNNTGGYNYNNGYGYNNNANGYNNTVRYTGGYNYNNASGYNNPVRYNGGNYNNGYSYANSNNGYGTYNNQAVNNNQAYDNNGGNANGAGPGLRTIGTEILGGLLGQFADRYIH